MKEVWIKNATSFCEKSINSFLLATKILFYLFFVFYILFFYQNKSDAYTKNEYSINGAHLYVFKFNPKEVRVVPYLNDYPIRAIDVVNYYNPFLLINGTFFYSNKLLGALFMHGEPQSYMGDNRATFFYYKNNTASINYLKYKVKLDICSSSSKCRVLYLDGINRPQNYYENILYTNGYLRPVLPTSGILLKINEDGTFEYLYTRSAMPSRGEYILLANHDLDVLNNLVPTDRIRVSIEPMINSNLDFYISGGPMLLYNGQNVALQSCKKEYIVNDIKVGNHMRTGLGIDSLSNIYVFSVSWPGCTLNELANSLKNLGLKDAMLLDGGYSSVLFADNRFLVGSEARANISYLMFFTN
ncbi:hypothetical protein Thena_0601 [Thermodesulfobium narugense DSM 14796]|uniref:Phosphodiester glycosidase domain-containing protein n=1 Tax=Thermodesulfobium narugense DSM 14796 TaxID=747365 RepID=M1E6M2_9BACT|nr:phosphodiester glycosidase family protein [Thermodesulfobium narugense]AEE14238.1 hypothetical protein Thena_0601 [Thermodesulfobium narugense DSM 14796]